MYEIRAAKKDDLTRLKEIWKLCFGDSDNFINFYYATRFKEDETVVLLDKGEIWAMLTILPVFMVTPDNRCYKAAMFYAIATHPQKQGQGWGSRLIDFSNSYLLKERNTGMTVLVPAEKRLFEFYRRLDYQEGFFIREASLTSDSIRLWLTGKTGPCTVIPATPPEYKAVRDKNLSGTWRLAYNDEEIDYQKKISQLSQADIYLLKFKETCGCAAIERIDSDRVLLKELLLPDVYIPSALQKIIQILPAKVYTLRLPVHSGAFLGGLIIPFGMIRFSQEHQFKIKAAHQGYLGLAFD